jgi:hypothetical protein
LETSTTDVVVEVVKGLIYVVGGGALLKILQWKTTNRTQRLADDRMDNAEIYRRYNELMDRIGVERSREKAEWDNRLRALDAGHQDCLQREEEKSQQIARMEAKFARFEMYTAGLEERLEEKGIRYRKWRDTPEPEPPGPTSPPRNGAHEGHPPEGSGL